MNDFLTVTQINSIIKEVFDSVPTFKNITVRGELSNYKGRNISGHIYFTIKDDGSVLKCVMFKYDALSLDLELKDGDDVLLTGSISSYVAGGYYQLIVRKISKFGEGDILLAKKQLIEKLNKEGVFSNKKELPKIPNKIGIIVGKNSAAAKDLEFNITRRWPLVEIEFFYSLVQGSKASEDLIKNIKIADSLSKDLLIISRGGGSVEDLSAFDDESLIRTLSSIKTPFISAVGHEINKSITDLVADKYASTPTAAAELAVPDKNSIISDLYQTKDYINSLYSNKIFLLETKIKELSSNKVMLSVEASFDKYLSKIDLLKLKIDEIYQKRIDKMTSIIDLYKQNIEVLNPKNTLKRGFVLLKRDDTLITKSTQLNENQSVDIVFSDNVVKTVIKKIE